jgi:general secretion pathway protein K
MKQCPCPSIARHRDGHRRQLGAALLAAMLTVTLVATFAAAALWQQWRAVEVEAAERARVQSSWVLIGALDWSRLILREDARAGSANGGSAADHLAEPWAVPLAEAKLSSFLAADKNVASDAMEGLPEAYLSGSIVDAQSKLNVRNLVKNGAPVVESAAAFKKLFELLGLPAQELVLLQANLRQALPASATPPVQPSQPGQPSASNPTPTGSGTGTPAPAAPQPAAEVSDTAPLMPQRTSQLVWLGLSPSTVAALEPYVTILPETTTLNLNTASAEAIYASSPTLDLASAKALVAARARSYFRSVADAAALVQQGQGGTTFGGTSYSVGSNYFEVNGRLRLDRIWVDEQSLLARSGIDVRIIWRERGAGTTMPPPKP